MDRTLPKIDACMISRALQINAAIADELISVCDPKQLKCPAQPEYVEDKLRKEQKEQELESLMDDQGVGLNTLKMRKMRLSKGELLITLRLLESRT